MTTTPASYATSVREQYEDLPYPYRDPEKEGELFHGADIFALDGFTHFGFAGRRNLREGARILVAGCGTGDSLILLAEQLVGANSELVAIDLSHASIAIAKARLAKRGLSERVTIHHLSILDVPSAGLGQFDAIECGGVLHHLPDPDAGLAALASVLKDDGIMGIMVYAQYGRMSIYLTQMLMKHLMTEDTPRAKKIEIAREFLNQVPATHWLAVKNEALINEIMWPDGSGVYDLFLHSVDRAYTVPQLYEWLGGAGLQLTAFSGVFADDTMYNPATYVNSPLLNEATANKPLPERQAIAELMNGFMEKHYFYASKQPKQAAELADDMVITYGPIQWLFASFTDKLCELLETVPVGGAVQIIPRPFPQSPPMRIVKSAHTIALIRAMDGKRSVEKIIDHVAQEAGASRSEVREQLAYIYQQYRSRQLVFLRHRSIAPYPTAPEIVERLSVHKKRGG